METQKRTIPQGFTVKRSMGQPKIFRKWEDYNIGDIVVGKINGVNEQTKFLTPGQPPKLSAVVEVLDVFFKGEDSAKYLGKNLVINNSAVLEKLMIEGGIYDKKERKFKMGEVIQIEYGGKTEVKNGDYSGKDAHVFTLDILQEGSGETVTTDATEDL